MASCPLNYSIREILADGTIECEYDDEGGDTGTGTGTVTTNSSTFGLSTSGSPVSVVATCPAGTITGGGYFFVFNPDNRQILYSRPVSNTQWQFGVSGSLVSAALTVYARCIQ